MSFGDWKSLFRTEERVTKGRTETVKKKESDV